MDSDKTYRMKSHHHPDWDYHSPGGYFIALCTARKISWLDQIFDRIRALSCAGEIVQEEILNTAKLRPNVKIDPRCVIPNPVHFVLWMEEKTNANQNFHLDTPDDSVKPKSKRTARTVHLWTADSVGSIKGQCTRRIRRETGLDFSWQRNDCDCGTRTSKNGFVSISFATP